MRFFWGGKWLDLSFRCLLGRSGAVREVWRQWYYLFAGSIDFILLSEKDQLFFCESISVKKNIILEFSWHLIIFNWGWILCTFINCIRLSYKVNDILLLTSLLYSVALQFK